MSKNYYHLFLSLVPGLGPKTYKKLLSNFGSAEDAWNASYIEVEKSGFGKNFCKKFESFREQFDSKSYLRKLNLARVNFLTQEDSFYPKNLLALKNPPVVIYTKGNESCLTSKNSIAIVGTRKITSYGREVTEKLASELAEINFTIVSGMALGVDATAHRSAIEVSGYTIAVLGNGVDLPFPRENESLYSEIIDKNGLIISEYPLGMQPTVGSFPARNRIVAALSDGVLVTEAGEESGSLITANIAFELGKPVFAVPGPITSSLSFGTSSLLKNGAKIVTRVEDIIDYLGLNVSKLKTKKRDLSGLSKEEKSIILQLEEEDMDIDLLFKKTKIKTQDLVVILSGLEMKNVVKNSGGIFRLT